MPHYSPEAHAKKDVVTHAAKSEGPFSDRLETLWGKAAKDGALRSI